ncbi:MAG: ankyrin repeat domain-containing protein [Alphaproteobacteria bacterium]|nr:ankyrin repeat domain-containing protein [Alphaproteobacteria bacterium]
MQPPSLDRLDPPRAATVNQPVDHAGNRYLHALCRGNAPVQKVLAAIDTYGADVSPVNNDGYSPLRYAVEYGNAETVSALLSRSAPAAYDTGGKTYNAVTAAVLRGRADVLAAVLDGGGAAHINAPGLDTRGEVEKNPALVLAVQKYQYDLIPLLVAAGADLNSSAPVTGFTPLMQAANNDAPRVVLALLRAGADINARGTQGQTVLHIAVGNMHRLEVLDTLIAQGADLEVRDAKGRTPLMFAVESGSTRAAEKLLAAGAKPDVRNEQENGETALMTAARKGHADCAAVLLKFKADVLLTDKFNRTAAKIAQDNPSSNRSQYDPMMGFSAPQPKTMLIEAEQKATAQMFEKQYREQKRRKGP